MSRLRPRGKCKFSKSQAAAGGSSKIDIIRKSNQCNFGGSVLVKGPQALQPQHTIEWTGYNEDKDTQPTATRRFTAMGDTWQHVGGSQNYALEKSKRGSCKWDDFF
jgi:hypothetical protein